MSTEYEIVDAIPVPPSKRRGNGHGGRREGSGRKPSDYERPQEKQDFDLARARHEAAKANLAELEFQKQLGEYVSRAAVRQASATALASLTQGLRSIPDNLERKFSLDAKVVQEIANVIDETLAELAAEFEMMVGSEDRHA